MEPISFAGTDYLGLSRDPRLAEGACRAAREYGISPSAGRWSIGWKDIHQRLEDKLAEFFGAEDACIQGAAYLGGPAFFASMAEKFRTVFCDERSHPNLLLGMRGAEFDIRTYRHVDAADLREKLAAYDGPPPIIATDGLYGIGGEMPPLGELAEIAREAGAELLVDDAHGVFACGPGGRGSLELFDLSVGPVTLMGSLSKALGAYGGFTAGRREVIDRMRRAVNYVGSTPMALPIAGACLAALDVLETEPDRRARMEAHGRRMREIIKERGIREVSDTRTPIVTMELADEAAARALAERMNERGLMLRYFMYPTEPRTGLLRAAARTPYTEEHMDHFAEALDAKD